VASARPDPTVALERAVVPPRDDHHGEATSLLRAVDGRRLVTSNHVGGETWTFVRKRAGHARAVAFLEAIAASPRLDVVHVSEALEDVAFRAGSFRELRP
jgi:predicted nucleic acid-binding protein